MPRPTPGSHHNNKLHVRSGDTVMVVSGKHKGQTGTVLQVNAEQQKVVVQGVNLQKKHVKGSAARPEGGIVEKEGAMHASKVRLVDGETGKPTRVRREVVDGKKVRVAVKSGKVLD